VTLRANKQRILIKSIDLTTIYNYSNIKDLSTFGDGKTTTLKVFSALGIIATGV